MKHRKVRTGLTLVELMLALALSAMLMVALVGVLQSTQRQVEYAMQKTKMDAVSAVMRVIKRDLMLAQTIRFENGWIELTGNFAHFGKDAIVRSVGYAVTPGHIEGSSILLRVTEFGGQAVGPSISGMAIERIDSAGQPQPLSAETVPIAGILRVWLWQVAVDGPTVQCDIVVH